MAAVRYSKELVTKICKLLASDDYTVTEIAKIVSINPCTYHEWVKTKPEFKKAIEDAEEQRFQTFKKAARSGLMTLLKGKEYDETTTEWVDDGKNKPKIKSKRTVKKFIMPNPTSVIFALKNLDKDNFRDTFSNELTGRDGGPIQHKVEATVVFEDMTEDPEDED